MIFLALHHGEELRSWSGALLASVSFCHWRVEVFFVVLGGSGIFLVLQQADEFIEFTANPKSWLARLLPPFPEPASSFYSLIFEPILVHGYSFFTSYVMAAHRDKVAEFTGKPGHFMPWRILPVQH
jgi:hypothetical protein